MVVGSSPTGPTNHPTGAQVIVRVLIYLSRRIGKPDFHRSRPGSVIFGSEWRLHRHWFDVSAMADLLGGDFTLAQKNTLYRCLDKLVAHKDALFKFLCERWGELFGAKFDVLLYDLTSTYFETDTLRDEGDKRQYGYSRDKRFDCRQVVIGLIVTPEGFPLSYEVLAGNSADSTTLGDFLNRIEQRYGHANRIWVMDRGVPTEESLAQMRAIGASYLVGTPKGRLTRMEQAFLSQPWQRVRDGIAVKRLDQDEDTYVLAQSDKRIDKERAMRRRRLKRYVSRSCLPVSIPEVRHANAEEAVMFQSPWKLSCLRLSKASSESVILMPVGYLPRSSSARIFKPARVVVLAIRLTMTS